MSCCTDVCMINYSFFHHASNFYVDSIKVPAYASNTGEILQFLMDTNFPGNTLS